jgi:hypothetical protein
MVIVHADVKTTLFGSSIGSMIERVVVLKRSASR